MGTTHTLRTVRGFLPSGRCVRVASRNLLYQQRVHPGGPTTVSITHVWRGPLARTFTEQPTFVASKEIALNESGPVSGQPSFMLYGHGVRSSSPSVK
jgi:hypothetical protein